MSPSEILPAVKDLLSPKSRRAETTLSLFRKRTTSEDTG
jgi:hypothetical protein